MPEVMMDRVMLLAMIELIRSERGGMIVPDPG
jgi:hypothetical protein